MLDFGVACLWVCRFDYGDCDWFVIWWCFSCWFVCWVALIVGLLLCGFCGLDVGLL